MQAKYFFRRCSVFAVVSTFCLVLFFASIVTAQRSEYRGFWVDTTNSNLNNHTDIVAVVNNAKAAKANAIFAQVRRRADSWYLNSLEPLPDFVSIASGFDPLADLIATAHAEGLEVHAYVVVGIIWSKIPTATPSVSAGPPLSSRHVFNLHAWNKATNTMRTGPENWLTKSLAPAPALVTFDGQRYGTDFWLDFGHPDAEAYSVDVVMHLVNNYNLDGLHLDSTARYPDFNVATGQPPLTPANGSNTGYNEVSVARFNARYNRTGSPLQGDDLWKQWRRDQVTNVIRRIYLNAIAAKPQLKVSGAFFANGNGPVCAPGADCKSIWETSVRAEAYWRVFQDWRAWTEEGIVDLAIPFNAKREHVVTSPSQVLMFDEWNEWTKNQQYNRATLVGIGNSVNSVEGTLRQTRRSLAPSAEGKSSPGVVFFSMGTSDIAVTGNPWAVPAGQSTPDRPFNDLALGLTAGRNGATLFEPNATQPGFQAIFAQPATVPVLSWKFAPLKGHLKGFVRRSDNSILDTATVTIKNLDTQAVRTTATDGGGFYGAVDLEPGNYQVKAELGSTTLYACSAVVAAGLVTTADVSSASTTPPTTTSSVDPAAPDGANGWYVTSPTLTLNGTAGCAALDRTEFSLNNGKNWQTYTAPITITQEGVTTVLFRSVDVTGNVETAGSRTFMVDLSDPTLQLTANPTAIWPPNGQMVNASLFGNAADSGSGLSGVAYSVLDEYLMPLSVEPRVLTGNSASWTDVLPVEAWRNSRDHDGRVYTVTATVRDAAGRTSSATVNILVPRDRRSGLDE